MPITTRSSDDPDLGLLTLGGGGLRLWAGTRDALAALQWRLQQALPGAAVLRLRGRRSRQFAGFFDEAAAVLQLPHYTGANLHAFDDGLLSLGWLPGTAYVLLIEDADQLLADIGDHNLLGLCESFERAHQAWETPSPGAPGRPFKVVLQASPEHLPALRQRLQGIGVSAREA